jgi:hypothetical protein
MTTPANYMAHFYAELNSDIAKMNAKNMEQPVKTRQLTEDEIRKIFGENPNHIKDVKV